MIVIRAEMMLMGGTAVARGNSTLSVSVGASGAETARVAVAKSREARVLYCMIEADKNEENNAFSREELMLWREFEVVLQMSGIKKIKMD